MTRARTWLRALLALVLCAWCAACSSSRSEQRESSSTAQVVAVAHVEQAARVDQAQATHETAGPVLTVETVRDVRPSGEVITTERRTLAGPVERSSEAVAIAQLATTATTQTTTEITTRASEQIKTRSAPAFTTNLLIIAIAAGVLALGALAWKIRGIL